MSVVLSPLADPLRFFTVTAERDAARAEIERESTHGEQRVQNLHTTYGHQLDQLRTELTQARDVAARLRRAPRQRSAAAAEGPTPEV